MKNLIPESLQLFADKISTNRLIKLSGQNCIYPTYHVVSNSSEPHLKYLYAIRSEKLFRQDLDFLLQHFTAISVNELQTNCSGKKPFFHLSFDDGLRQCYDWVLPILEEKGIPASFFVNPVFIDNKDMIYRMKISLLLSKIEENAADYYQWEGEKISSHEARKVISNLTHADSQIIDSWAQQLDVSFSDFLKEKKPYLTWAQLKIMQEKGFTVGAHSMSHPDYRLLNLDQQLDETFKSLDALTQKISPANHLFAFPFTDDGISKEFFGRLRERYPACKTFGVAGMKHDSAANHFHRIPMERNLLSACKIINAQYLYYLIKKPLGKNKIYR